MTMEVHNLATNDVMIFAETKHFGREDALVSAALLHDDQAELINDIDTRNDYKRRIIYGERTMALNGLGILRE